MVRFQPLSDDDSDDISVDSHEDQPQRSTRPHSNRSNLPPQPSDSEDEDEDDGIQLPLRSVRTPQVKQQSRTRMEEDEYEDEEERKQPMVEEDEEFDTDETYEDDQQYEDEKYQPDQEHKYTSRHAHTKRSSHADVDARKLHLMENVLMDEEEESFMRPEQMDQTESIQSPVATSRSRFVMPPQRSVKPTPPLTHIQAFLAAAPSFVRPNIHGHHQRNPLATTSSTAPPPPHQRSVLDFMQHSFRVGWSPTGGSFFFATGIDGFEATQEEVDLVGVDQGVQDAAASNSVSLAGKKELATSLLETHLEFHSKQAAPSSAKVFGATPGLGGSSGFAFGSHQLTTSQAYTPFTKLADSYLSSLRTPRSHPITGNDLIEVEFAISTWTLLRALFSREEAERRAPKLSKGADLAERQKRGISASGSQGEDLSILTAREDPYALLVGREDAFEQGWLQPQVREDFVKQRIYELQTNRDEEKGSDGVTGNKMQQVIAHLVGHDLLAAVDSCISAGNFRLATLISQLDSFSFSGRLGEDGRPLIESSQHDISRTLSLWTTKDRGLGAYIPKDIETIFRLMSGDVLINPQLGWMEAFGLHYWYAQPKSEQTNIQHALLGYKKHAFSHDPRFNHSQGQVRKPFPAYGSYVPVALRRGVIGASSSGTGLDDDADLDDSAMDDAIISSQAMVITSGTTAAPASSKSAIEYFDMRYGLIDLYTGQSQSLDRVLSPQSHTSHMLDHTLAWHVFSTLQDTPVKQMPRSSLARLHMSFIHQLELFGEQLNDPDFWQWTVYVALAATFPRGEEFDREQVVKTLLLKHVRWTPENPFALPSQAQQHASSAAFGSFAPKPTLPLSLPILKLDSSTAFELTIIQQQGEVVQQQQLSWGSSGGSNGVEKFLLQRCHLPAAWLYESKAISAVYDAEWSVACFYHLHAGQIQQAYQVFRDHLMSLWILAVLNEAESGASGQSSVLENGLFSILQIFHQSGASLFNWSTSGGGLVLSFLEFRRYFHKNLTHFSYRDISVTSKSLKERQERLNNFGRYRAELKAFLHQVDALAREKRSNDLDATSASLERLAWSKMSGSVLQHLHALQPLEQEMAPESIGSFLPVTTDASDASAVDVSSGEFVSAADRLSVLTDWKDTWMQQYE